MSKEWRTLGKRFPTFAALIRPFSSVNSPVFNEGGIISKGFPIISALIRPWTSVKSLMLMKGRTLIESALIRSFSSVDSLMLKEHRVLAKWFPTFIAFIWPFPGMNSLVYNEVWLLGNFSPVRISFSPLKGCLTLSSVWPLPGVSSPLLEKLRPGQEVLLNHPED